MGASVVKRVELLPSRALSGWLPTEAVAVQPTRDKGRTPNTLSSATDHHQLVEPV
jgi:hypothetical protein